MSWSHLAKCSLAMLWIFLSIQASCWAQHERDIAFEKTMGDNYVKALNILDNMLLGQDYKMVEESATAILQHVDEVNSLSPSLEPPERQWFQLYVNQLKWNTEQLISFAQEIHKIQQSQQRPPSHTQVLAAQQFGHMITTCVSCHSQFLGALKKRAAP